MSPQPTLSPYRTSCIVRISLQCSMPCVRHIPLRLRTSSQGAEKGRGQHEQNRRNEWIKTTSEQFCPESITPLRIPAWSCQTFPTRECCLHRMCPETGMSQPQYLRRCVCKKLRSWVSVSTVKFVPRIYFRTYCGADCFSALRSLQSFRSLSKACLYPWRTSLPSPNIAKKMNPDTGQTNRERIKFLWKALCVTTKLAGYRGIWLKPV